MAWFGVPVADWREPTAGHGLGGDGSRNFPKNWGEPDAFSERTASGIRR